MCTARSWRVVETVRWWWWWLLWMVIGMEGVGGRVWAQGHNTGCQGVLHHTAVCLRVLPLLVLRPELFIPQKNISLGIGLP